jgi:hypothetical protein
MSIKSRCAISSWRSGFGSCGVGGVGTRTPSQSPIIAITACWKQALRLTVFGEKTLRWEIATAGCRSREIGDTPSERRDGDVPGREPGSEIGNRGLRASRGNRRANCQSLPNRSYLFPSDRENQTGRILSLHRSASSVKETQLTPFVVSGKPLSRPTLFLLALGFSIQLTIMNGVSREPPCPKSAGDDYTMYINHVVEIGSDGELLCRANPKELFRKIGEQRCKRIILYVHGGRVTLEIAREKAASLTEAIQRTDPDAYPIFLNWEAGQLTSYFRQFAYERNGVSYRGIASAPIVAVTAPLMFVSDIGRGAFRFPINTMISVGKILQNCDGFVGRHDHFFPLKGKFDEQLLALRSVTPVTKDSDRDKMLSDIYRHGLIYSGSSHGPTTASVSMGHDSRRGWLGYGLVFVGTLPLQFGTEPILDTFGTPAWNNMIRRTRSMFCLQSNFVKVPHRSEQQPEKDTLGICEQGGAGLFFDELAKFMHDRSGDGFTLEIYAHSMGTMITNEALAEHSDLPVHHIVYMGAACSIRDFQRSAGRYIEKNNIPFYNLSLHPRSELAEVEVSGIPVRGSLLVWIDEFFNQSQSFDDRTLGTFENAVIALDLLHGGSNVHLKAFSVEDGLHKHEDLFAGPQNHCDFGNYCFWEPEFYNTDKAGCYYSRIPEPRSTKQRRRDLSWRVQCK